MILLTITITGKLPHTNLHPRPPPSLFSPKSFGSTCLSVAKTLPTYRLQFVIMSTSSDSDAPNTSSSLNPPTYSRDMPSDSTLVGYNETSQQRSLPLSSSSQALAGLSDYQYSYPQTTTEGFPKTEFVASSPKSTFVKTSLKEPRLSGGGVGVSEGKSSSSTGTESESDPGSSERYDPTQKRQLLPPRQPNNNALTLFSSSTDEEDRRLKESAMRKVRNQGKDRFVRSWNSS